MSQCLDNVCKQQILIFDMENVRFYAGDLRGSQQNLRGQLISLWWSSAKINPVFHGRLINGGKSVCSVAILVRYLSSYFVVETCLSL